MYFANFQLPLGYSIYLMFAAINRRVQHTVDFTGHTNYFQTVSWLAFLGAFEMNLWLLIAATILVCGFLYGVASYIVHEYIFPSPRSRKTSLIYHIKTTGLFTFGAYFAQGKSVQMHLCDIHDDDTCVIFKRTQVQIFR